MVSLVGAAVALAWPALAGATSMTSFVHVSTADNTSGFLTEMDHPRLNDNPDARVFVTQRWNYLAGQGNQNDRAIGVRYDVDFSGNGRWSIFNQDVSLDMEPGLAFNVMVVGEGSASFLHLTTYDNISNIASYVTCPPGFESICYGASHILHQHTLNAWGLRGARFPSPSSCIVGGGALTVRAESTDPALYPNMRPGALFWILAGSEEFQGRQAFTHVADPSNTVGWATKLDDPRLNGHPEAIVIATRSGPAGPTQEEHIGVLYANDGSADIWSIIHQTTAPIPDGASFAVFLPPLFADGFESGDLSWWQ